MLVIYFKAWMPPARTAQIRHVMSGVNPQGCQVFSFKQPTNQELEHDFLWRTSRCLPNAAGSVSSTAPTYEDVLIARVHPEILHGHGLPDELIDETGDLGTALPLHQRLREAPAPKRHADRQDLPAHVQGRAGRSASGPAIDAPDKNWKFSLADITNGPTGTRT